MDSLPVELQKYIVQLAAETLEAALVCRDWCQWVCQANSRRRFARLMGKHLTATGVMNAFNMCLDVEKIADRALLEQVALVRRELSLNGINVIHVLRGGYSHKIYIELVVQLSVSIIRVQIQLYVGRAEGRILIGPGFYPERVFILYKKTDIVSIVDGLSRDDWPDISSGRGTLIELFEKVQTLI